MSELCVRRLRRELQSLAKNPIENIEALPLEQNIREWHFVIKGAVDSAYVGGYYHGKLEFTKDYPLKPPAIRLITPSGRFKEGSKLCFSFSDFHPEVTISLFHSLTHSLYSIPFPSLLSFYVTSLLPLLLCFLTELEPDVVRVNNFIGFPVLYVGE